MEPDPPLELDRERIETLSRALLLVMREHMLGGEIKKERVLEVLNALAICAGTVLKGTEDATALDFFSSALNRNLH